MGGGVAESPQNTCNRKPIPGGGGGTTGGSTATRKKTPKRRKTGTPPPGPLAECRARLGG